MNAELMLLGVCPAEAHTPKIYNERGGGPPRFTLLASAPKARLVRCERRNQAAQEGP